MVDGDKLQLALGAIDKLLAQANADPEVAGGSKLMVLRVPPGTRVLGLEGSSPRDAKKRGYDQLRVTFVGTSEGMGYLGRQLAMAGPWGLERKDPSQASLGLEGGQDGIA